MGNSQDMSGRRELLRVCGAVAVAGLAGCSGGDGSSDGSGDGEAEENLYDGYLENANGFEERQDLTDESQVEITVGAGSGLAFDPAAVRISAETTVTWTWTSKGGAHNVRAESDTFESELIGQAGHTFDYTFDSTGVYKYVCDPHSRQGMKGVVEVI
jgi:halocyanin-like protein